MHLIYMDIPKVRGKMAEHGYTITSMSEHLGVSRNTLSKYLETPGKMPYSVISSMAGAICDTAEEASRIFLHLTYVKRKK